MLGTNAQRRLFALSACLPESDVVEQLVHMSVKALLSLFDAPDLNAIFNEPLHHKGRFVLTSSETVEHKHQQNIEFLGRCLCLDFRQCIAIGGSSLVAGDALFQNFVY